MNPYKDYGSPKEKARHRALQCIGGDVTTGAITDSGMEVLKFLTQSGIIITSHIFYTMSTDNIPESMDVESLKSMNVDLLANHGFDGVVYMSGCDSNMDWSNGMTDSDITNAELKAARHIIYGDAIYQHLEELKLAKINGAYHFGAGLWVDLVGLSKRYQYAMKTGVNVNDVDVKYNSPAASYFQDDNIDKCFTVTSIRG